MQDSPYPPSLTGFVIDGPYVFIAVAVTLTTYPIIGTAVDPYTTGIRPQVLIFAITTIIGIITARPLLTLLQQAEAAAPFSVSTTLTRVQDHHHTILSATLTLVCFYAYGAITAVSWTYLKPFLPSAIGVPALVLTYIGALVITEALILHHTGNETPREDQTT